MLPNDVREDAESICHYIQEQFPTDSPYVAAAMRVLDWLRTLPEAPRPDWSQAPGWARWWTCNFQGIVRWFEQRPQELHGHWIPDHGKWSNAVAHIEIPLHIDWRTLCEERPKEVGND